METKPKKPRKKKEPSFKEYESSIVVIEDNFENTPLETESLSEAIRDIPEILPEAPVKDLTLMSPKDALFERSLAYNNVKSIEEMSAKEVLVDSINKVARVYNLIAESITQTEIKSMSVRDKILALQKLSHIHEVANKNIKGNSPTFQQINVFKAGREELEAAIMSGVNEE